MNIPNKLLSLKSNSFRLLIISMLFLPMFSCAGSRGLDQEINRRFMPIASAWESFVLSEVSFGLFSMPIVLLVLIGGAMFFTVYFGFINIRRFPLAIKVVRGTYDQLEHSREIKSPKSTGNGETNHFQALATAISGTVGLGNISMVAVAISAGGPGATFWMILAGLLGMSTKFVECTLGVKYRDIDKNGRVYGGPMYYLSKGLKEKGKAKLGKILAIMFATCCVGSSLGGGNAMQSNQAAAQIISQLGLTGSATGTVIGLIIAVLVGVVIIGGIQRIAKVTEKVVPIMAGLYVLAALVILFSNFTLLDDAFRLIISEAFTPRATITGGFIGVMLQGFRRAAFSNEAGAGSSAIAHATVDTQYPVSEGLVALLEPFIDTVVICTITALVIVIFNMNGLFIYGDMVNNQALLLETGQRIGGVNITSMAFDNALPGFSLFLMIAVALFAFSTIISWSYYGLQSWKYLFGRGRIADLTYKILFLTFTVMGSAVTFDAVIKFSDAMILAMVFPNMIGLLFLFTKVKTELQIFLTAIKYQNTTKKKEAKALSAA